MWTESIAVGDEDYIVETQKKLSSLALGRKVIPESGAYILREPSFTYKAHIDAKNNDLRIENTYLWEVNDELSNT
jgi:putative transposase